MESNSVCDDTSDKQKLEDGAAGVIIITDRIGLHKRFGGEIRTVDSQSDLRSLLLL